MKKNIVRVLSLLLATAMLIGCAACTQTINVRFVDKDGNDLNLGGIINTNANANTDTPASETPATQAPASETPASETPASETPASQAPASETPASQAPASETPASQAPASETPAASTGMPSGTQAIADFYKAAVNKIKNDGAAGYIKKEWQVIGDLNLFSAAKANDAVKGVAGNFFKDESKAEDQNTAKGDQAKDRFPGFTLTDYSKIASATCTQNGGNYDIKIVMVDEDTPHKSGSMLSQVTNSFLVWEDIEDTLKNDSTVKAVLNSYENIHVIYKGYTIEATITPDGKFVSLKHHGDIHISIGSATVLFVFKLNDKSVDMENVCTYRDFAY
ncbi:MAG: hypothetical protein IJT27_08785 [Clostridia bacterium]|nr:hypothetical protein [Clostridia bacterium]